MTDLQKIRELQGKVMKDIAAGALIPIMMIGDELNLFEKLYKLGPISSKDFSKKIDSSHYNNARTKNIDAYDPLFEEASLKIIEKIMMECFVCIMIKG